ncbi:unnamed protein product [Adineta ricciae]|uniref:Uncharacterized protein n=1 Tax=Adineta ricciae TaxID=249248 RepID=A0A814CFL0_ADIRI|nr:unnamed protein product [Adineta ricciae]
MSTPLSRSLASTEAVAGLDDSVFSPVHVNYVLYEQQQSRSVSSESYDDDDEIVDDVDTSEEEEEAPMSAFYEANDALMNVLKAHVELTVKTFTYSLEKHPITSSLTDYMIISRPSTHRYLNRKKKNDYKNSPKHLVNDHNNHHSKQSFNSDYPSQYYDTKFVKRTRSAPNTALSPQQIIHDQYSELNTIIYNTRYPITAMEHFIAHNPLASPPLNTSSTSEPSGHGVTNLASTPLSPSSAMRSPQPQRDLTSPRLSETAEVTVYPSSVSLRGLLSYQDVMNAIEREFHLHEGQEREIIMKLWLKGQTMISILQRYRHLLQDLNLDDQDFVNGMKQIREMVNFADRDVHYLREQTIMLENQNRFLESEFQRQLDKIVLEKNEQINRLIHIIDQTCAPPAEFTDQVRNFQQTTTHSDIFSQRFVQQNIELQHELETLRAKLEYTFALLNEKLDQHGEIASPSIIQTAIEQMRRSDMKLQELQLRTSYQQEENDLLRYIMNKSQQSSSPDVTQLFSIIEQRSLERELHRVRHELELTENKIVDLEQKFENSDESVKFNIERLKLKCDVLRQHISTCSRRLNEAVQQFPDKFLDDHDTSNLEPYHDDKERRIIQLENELFTVRQQYNELLEYSNTIKFELDNARKQLHERSLYDRETFNSSTMAQDSSELEQERRRAGQLENDLISLKIKYDDVCERVTAATLQLERVQVVLDQTLRRCEQLEKEKTNFPPVQPSVFYHPSQVHYY